MIEVYVKLIEAGKKTLGDVPERYRSAVEAELAKGAK
jgi:hypothetical protein